MKMTGKRNHYPELDYLPALQGSIIWEAVPDSVYPHVPRFPSALDRDGELAGSHRKVDGTVPLCRDSAERRGTESSQGCAQITESNLGMFCSVLLPLYNLRGF